MLDQQYKEGYVVINNEQYKYIVASINKNFKQFYEKYDFYKYSKDDYKVFQNDFSSLKVKNTSIKEALKWKWGDARKSNFPMSHKNLIKEVELNWKDFALERFTNPDNALKNQDNNLV